MLKEFGFARDFTSRYELGVRIGAGSFATVHSAVDRHTGQEVAVKVITKRITGGCLEHNFMKRVQHEVDIYNHLGRSLNVAYMYGAFEDATTVKLVMELCTGGELWSRVRAGRYDEAAAAALAREILRTLAQCHAKGIVLRDVKPENFLFLTPAEDAPLKMIDFGLATYCRPGQLLSDRAGSPLYVAPEVLKQAYGQPCDVWSAGVMAYQLLAGRFPFEDEDRGLLLSSLDVLGKKNFSNKEVFFSILYGELDFARPPWDVLSASARDFVASLLQRDPATRPTAAEALQHPWLAQFDAQAAGGDGSGAHASNGSGGGSGGGTGGAASRPLSESLVQRLQQYGTYGRLKQLALRAVAGFMAAGGGPEGERVAALAAAFRGLDSDGRGHVPYERVVQLLSSGEWELSETEVSQLLSSFDVDAAGNVDYCEWLAALIDWREVQDSPAWRAYVDRVFDLFDSSHTGRLTPDSLQRVLCGGLEALDPALEALRPPDGAPGLLQPQQQPRPASLASLLPQLAPAAAAAAASAAAALGGAGSSPAGGGRGQHAAGEDDDDDDLCPFDDVVPAALREAGAGADGSISREDFLSFLAGGPGDRLEVYESRRRRQRAE